MRRQIPTLFLPLWPNEPFFDFQSSWCRSRNVASHPSVFIWKLSPRLLLVLLFVTPALLFPCRIEQSYFLVRFPGFQRLSLLLLFLFFSSFSSSPLPFLLVFLFFSSLSSSPLSDLLLFLVFSSFFFSRLPLLLLYSLSRFILYTILVLSLYSIIFCPSSDYVYELLRRCSQTFTF